MNALKIALVVETGGGGSGRHFLDLAAGLVDRGHRVEVAYSPRRAEPRFRDKLSAIRGLTLIPIDMRRSPHPSDLAAFWRLRRFLAARGPFDIVHGHSSKAVLACLAAVGLPLHRVFTPHALRSLDPDLSAPVRFGFRTAERVAIGTAHQVIAVSSHERDYLVGLGLPAEAVRVVVNGLPPGAGPPDDARPRWRGRLGLAEGDVAIGFLGRLVPQKAPELLLDAFARLEAGRNVVLVIAGDGPLRPGLERQARRLGIADRLRWAGDVDGPEVMAAFDVFALPSRYEALPYVLLEALATGLPIVATPVGGTRETVVQERNGLVARDHDPAGFARALGRLIEDREGMRRMAEESAAMSLSFGLSRMVDETLAVYREALSPRPLAAVRGGAPGRDEGRV